LANKYLIDSNIFFQAKDLWYQFGFCQQFWKWIEEGHQANVFFSTKKVKKEINDGHASCPAKAWVKNSVNASFFLEDDSVNKVNVHYSQLMNWATDQHAKKVYSYAALANFAKQDKADAYLIAAAKHYQCDIVTHETPTTGGTGVKNIKIPNAAAELGVKTITLFDLLHKHAGPAFTFKP
jgi:hypothetical protein